MARPPLEPPPQTLRIERVAQSRSRREAAFASVLALCLAAITFVVSAHQAANADRRALEITLQNRAQDIARTVDATLRTYRATLDTIAQSRALRVDFDLAAMAQDAQVIGDQFGGWFMVADGGPMMTVLMDSRIPFAPPQQPMMRANDPALMRAERDSERFSRSAVSDAYAPNPDQDPIVTLVRPIAIDRTPRPYVYFSVTLDDISQTLQQAHLDEGEIVVLADGSRRVIASSADDQTLVLAGLQGWFVQAWGNRTGLVTLGPSVGPGPPRMMALQGLINAPDWTLAISRPQPSFVTSAADAAWPGLLALSVLIVTASIANLVLDRRRNLADVFHAAREVAEREQLLAKVSAADARKARLMAILAHDLRTPLVALLGSLDVYRAAEDAASRARVVERMQRDGHGMLQLIDDVLELARLGAGEVRLRPEPFSPPMLLEDVATLIRPQAARNGTTVQTDIAGVPPLLMGDLAALRRVLLNFATNAVKATQNGTITLSVSGAPAPHGHHVIFTVSDTGHGIAEQDIPKLFRDFGMLERDGVARQGTGLGLAICRRLATAMGGTVCAESTLGRGSSFWLRLTLAEATEGTADDDPDDEDPTRVLTGLHILVAEDHETIRQLTCASLARCGAYPTEAADGQEAVDLAQAHVFDVILMDQNMPNLDGTEAAAQIRQGGGPSANAHIICITAHQNAAIATMLSNLALDGFLRKPINLTKLAALLQNRAVTQIDTDGLPEFDGDTLSQLRDIDDGALLARTLHRLANEITTVSTDLAILIEQDDRIAAKRLAHKLAGFCDVLGARRLSRSLRSFEAQVETADAAHLRVMITDVQQDLATTREAALLLADPAEPR